MKHNNLISRVLAATNDGLDIIIEECPAAAEVVNNPRKKFRFRPDERTPSAVLVLSDDGKGWHIRDYGLNGREGWISAIGVYMWNRGWDRDKFNIALQALAERYGVQDELKPGVNMPVVEQRNATPDEKQRKAWITLFDGLGGIDLSTWQSFVTPEHLMQLNWYAVEAVYSVKGDMLTIRKSTATYPIFAKKCPYANSEGHEMYFWKVYEPLNPDKAFRFRIVGDKQPDYIYGLAELICVYHQNKDEKLEEVLLVSGCSDAVSVKAMGYQPVWLDSETRMLTNSQFILLLKYAKRIINIPDIDSTGIRMGKSLALAIPTLYTVWLKPEDFYGLHDNRGRLCKDLRDFLRLNPTHSAMKKLLGRARLSQFWSERFDNKGNVTYSISGVSLAYFLWLNGYSTLKDDYHNEPQYIRVNSNIVYPVKSKSIVNFLENWCEQEGLPEGLVNKLISTKFLPTKNESHLVERDDLDFSSATATSQTMYFENCKVTVTAEGISHQPYSSCTDNRYVWEDSVIKHTYRKLKAQFTWAKNEDGRYVITFAEDAPSKMLHVVRNMARLHWRKQDEYGLQLSEEEKAEEMQALVVIMLTIGYLLHRYKSPSAAYAPLLLDYAIGNSAKERNGRSGKSFLLNAVGSLLNKAYIDMSNLSKKSNQQFGFSRVKESTGLVIVDECPENFAFNELYAKISDDMEVERKGKDPVVIPFCKAPKFAIATNHTLKDHSPSTEGRIAYVVVADYYHVQTQLNDYLETRKICDEYHQNLLDSEYAETDWQADIHFMLECLQMYLSMPVSDRRQMPPMARIERRELQSSISESFRQWADENLGEGSEWLDKKVRADELLNAYNQDTRYNCSLKTFTEQLKKWCRYAEHISCYNPASCTGKKNDGDRWQDREGKARFNYYYLQSKSAAESSDKSEAIQADLFSSTEDAPF